MRRIIVLTAAICSFPAATSTDTTASAAVAVLRCPPPHSHVFRSDRTAVIYEGLNSEKLYEVLGCVRGEHRAYVLGRTLQGSEEGGGGIAKEVLAGPIVAYEKSSYSTSVLSTGFSRVWVFVRDLRTGRILHKLPTGTAVHPGDVGKGRTSAIVVKADGAVAWINPIEAPVSWEIHAVDGSGSRVLASGTGIDPHSLRLKGSTLSWVQSGKTEFATLH
ncbi:MAG: hypothetical protein ABSB69_12810 [Solirubrobacteraceae bacterium]